MVNIAPVDTNNVELGDTPEEVALSIKEWENTLLRLQKETDVAVLDRLIIARQTDLDRTGARVNLATNPAGAITQAGLEKAIQALQSARNIILDAPLPDVQYAGE